jgi:hypothetical protein
MGSSLKAVVRGGRAVLIEDRVAYPEGTELELEVREPVEELDAGELRALDAALEAGERERQATGKVYTSEDVLARARASR